MQTDSRSLALDNNLGYLLLGIAEARFGCAPAKMTEAQRREAERVAQRQFDIEQKVLSSAEARVVIVPSSEVSAAVDNIRARYGDGKEFIRELESNDLDEAQLREALTRELKVEAVLARVAARTPPVDDTEVRLYYYLHLRQFEQPETRVARHILITINPTFPENKRDVAAQRCAAIAKRLARKPDRFGEQAGKHSECPTALDGGRLGRLKRDTLYPELDAVLFTLREGGVSEVIESPLGFHILFCEKIYRAGPPPLTEVLPKLRERLTARAANLAKKRWIEQLLGAAQTSGTTDTKELAIDG